ncbi:MAG: prepilin-type N-terminal cleavage/methylation domain-containing protein [Deltaproteobacteria bacterium]|uniref:Prepilin-type N-terminal cleavage/methylation domain-containing protein n=1 Tax=Candidatus Zymogenus saltonus TaxID=2844893 RepID=A0A9D8KGM2_9DELT|nr:prepilin-type N-terminal cleavage/methylation domain-containing protein [Candidatus Zymogenus saltonus]
MEKIRKLIKCFGSKEGFTLVEILITVLISMIIMAAVFEVFIAQKRSYVTEGALLEVENTGHFAMEYLTRTVQNSGYNIKNGMKIESASDHYFTAVMDEDDDGVIQADEILTLAINTPYLDMEDDTPPTEIVHDPELNTLATGGPHEYYMDVYFDMDGDGNVKDSEVMLCGYDLDDTADDDAMGQMDAVKLYLNGPPYSLYRYTFKLHNESNVYNAATNPYIVNPKPDTIADNVENFIIRYYDEENLPLPVTTDDNGNRIVPKPPYILTREEMGRIRRVEFDLLIRSSKEDPKWNDDGTYPVGSVATYESGLPKGWSCGDSGFRDQEPFLTDCNGLTDWECFISHCNTKQYPTYGEFIPYSDHYRRLFLSASATPKNLILNPYGRLNLSATPPKLRCPDNEVELTATLKDKEGLPIANRKVNFYSTANLSLLDYSDVTSVDGEGNPMTDANGEVSGIKLRPDAPTGEAKKPVTITISADSTITANINGVDKEFPVYSSITVPFIVGPPATLEFKDVVISAYACDDAPYKAFEVYAKDCNGFEVDGAQIEFEFYDGGTSGTLGSNQVPGKYFIMESGGTRSYFDSGDPNIALEVEDESGMYKIWYEAPKIMDTSKTYPTSLGIKANATKYEDKPLADPEPDGWDTTVPTVAKEIVLETGLRPFYITADPPNYDDSGCRGNDTYVYVEGFDCGGYPVHKSSERDYEIYGEVENIADPSADTFGELTNKEEDSLSPPHYLPWDSDSLKFIAKYLVTGCANLDVVERIKLIAHKDTSGTEYTAPDVDEKEIDASLAECPEGLNLVLRAKGPHTDPYGSGEMTDGFFRDGCEYDNLDIEARIILNVPPTTNCDDVINNPVTFTITGGSSNARFLNTGTGVYDLITVQVYSNSEAKAIIPIKLLSGCSLTEITIMVHTDYGSYSATEYMILPVVPDEVLFMYRDSCYTERLTSANALRTGDTVYLEVRDCCRDTSALPDDLTVMVYEWTSTYEDVEYVTLTETGNNTGVFRGKVLTRGLPAGWASTDYDGVLDITNAGHINMRYWDTGGTLYIHNEAAPFVPTVVDRCAGGIKIMENFSTSADDGLTDDKARFPFFNENSSEWSGFSTANITESTSPVLVPDADTFKLLMMQFCDEFFISGSVPFKALWETPGTMFLPPSVQPPIGYVNSESFVWIDLDESVVGEDNSEMAWDQYTMNFRFKYIGGPDKPSYAPVDEVSVGDYYLPSSVDEGVIIIFRAAGGKETISAVDGSPTMDVLNRGYFVVWTKDSSGDPLVRFYRVDNPNWSSPDPVTLVINQVGNDVTPEAPNYFTKQYDDGNYHRIYGTFDGQYFDIWIDDQKLDFGTITGYSAHDRNFFYGTAGFGVKNIIAKFDNFQVCGCPPLTIVADDGTFPEGVEVELTITDVLTGYPAIAPVAWTVTPSNAGEFSSPSTGTTVGFTRETGDPFPEYFMATDANNCIAYLYPEPPTPACFIDDFEADKGYTLNTHPTDNWDVYGGNWWIRNFNGSWVVAEEYNSGTKLLILKNPAAEPYWQTSVDHATGTVIGTHDNYSMKADIYFDDDARAPSGGTMAGFIVRLQNNTHYYTVMLRNEYGDYGDNGDVDLRISRYNGSWNYRFGVDISNSTSSPAFPEDTLVTMKLDVDDNTIRVRLYDSTGSLYTYTDTGGPDAATANDGGNVDFTWTDSLDLFKTGRPAFRIYSDGAKYDNLEICPNP